MSFDKVQLGCDAIAFVRFKISTQASFWQGLCRLPLEDGTVITFVPQGRTRFDLLHFAWHVVWRADLENPMFDRSYRDQEKGFVDELIKRPGERIVIFRVDIISADRPVWEHSGAVTTYVRPLYHGHDHPVMREIYNVTIPGISSDELANAYDNLAQRMPFMCAVTSLPPDVSMPSDRIVTKELLSALALRTEAILVGAYQDDATLIWTPGDQTGASTRKS